MAKNNLYKVLVNIFEQEQNDENEKKEEESDIKNIEDFLKKYKIIENVKDISISFGYSNFGLESQKLSRITDSDIISNFETEKKSLEINNQNVLSILRYINREIKNKIKDKLYDQNKKQIKSPFILKISWKYGAISYYVEANYFNKILTINDYTINDSNAQFQKINKFINQRKKQIKNSPFRLLGSIFIFNDWFYDWNIDKMESELQNRKI